MNCFIARRHTSSQPIAVRPRDVFLKSILHEMRRAKKPVFQAFTHKCEAA